MNMSLKMVRRNLEGIREFPVPIGFSLRWYQPGDEIAWRRIHLEADKLNLITTELFCQQFGSDHSVLRNRQCYLLNSRGDAVGTGAAWFNDNFESQRYGRIHWVAVLPEYEGHGLGKALMTALCHRLRDLGHDRAYLSTSSARMRAIHLYLRFGFVPLPRGEPEEAVWRELMQKLGAR